MSGSKSDGFWDLMVLKAKRQGGKSYLWAPGAATKVMTQGYKSTAPRGFLSLFLAEAKPFKEWRS